MHCSCCGRRGSRGRKILAALVALLGLSGAASAQTCALPLLAASADLKPVPGSDLMTVPVEVNGTPKQFLLDIGTNPTEISQAAVAQLGLPETTKRTENIGANSGNMQARGGNLSALTNGGLGSVSVYDVRDKTGAAGAQTRVRITSFTIGRATGKSLQFLVANDAEMGKSEPYDGLLTGDFFKQYDVELDFAGREINYLTPTKCTDPNQVVFWSHTAVAVIPMTMADGKIRAGIGPGTPRQCRDRHQFAAHRDAPRHRGIDRGAQGRYAGDDARERPQRRKGPAGLWPHLLANRLPGRRRGEQCPHPDPGQQPDP